MFGQIGRLINRIALSDRNYRFLFEAEPGQWLVEQHGEVRALADGATLAQLVERRRGGVRLGPFAFEIHRGSRLEGRYAFEPAGPAPVSP